MRHKPRLFHENFRFLNSIKLFLSIEFDWVWWSLQMPYNKIKPPPPPPPRRKPWSLELISLSMFWFDWFGQRTLKKVLCLILFPDWTAFKLFFWVTSLSYVKSDYFFLWIRLRLGECRSCEEHRKWEDWPVPKFKFPTLYCFLKSKTNVYF